MEEGLFTPEIIVDEMEFFKDENGEVRYHELCVNCKKKCKQSFRMTSLICSKRKEITK